MTIGSEYLKSVTNRFAAYKALGNKTFGQLTDAQMQLAPNDASNSISIIVQHLGGNMLSRWTNLLTEDGEKSWRKRDEEFEEQYLSKEALLGLWNRGWKVLFDTLENLQEEDLLKTIRLSGAPLTVVEAINRYLSHYSYHVGQIVFMGKVILAGEWKNLSVPKAPPKSPMNGEIK
jgi:hypothetical protein